MAKDMTAILGQKVSDLLAAIEADYPGWHVRRSADGLHYRATRVLTRAEVAAVKADCGEGWTAADAVTLEDRSPDGIRREVALWHHQFEVAAARRARMVAA